MVGGELGYIVGPQVRGDVTQRSSHNLLDLARVKVNARPEFSHFFSVLMVANGVSCAVQIEGSDQRTYLIARD